MSRFEALEINFRTNVPQLRLKVRERRVQKLVLRPCSSKVKLPLGPCSSNVRLALGLHGPKDCSKSL